MFDYVLMLIGLGLGAGLAILGFYAYVRITGGSQPFHHLNPDIWYCTQCQDFVDNENPCKHQPQ